MWSEAMIFQVSGRTPYALPLVLFIICTNNIVRAQSKGDVLPESIFNSGKVAPIGANTLDAWLESAKPEDICRSMPPPFGVKDDISAKRHREECASEAKKYANRSTAKLAALTESAVAHCKKMPFLESNLQSSVSQQEKLSHCLKEFNEVKMRHRDKETQEISHRDQGLDSKSKKDPMSLCRQNAPSVVALNDAVLAHCVKSRTRTAASSPDLQVSTAKDPKFPPNYSSPQK
jgi:hypothetical protein